MSDRLPEKGGHEAGPVDDLPPVPENFVHRCPTDRPCPIEWPAHTPGEWETVFIGELPSPTACAERIQGPIVGRRLHEPCPACHHPAVAHAEGVGCGLCRLTAEVREQLPRLVRDEVRLRMAERIRAAYLAMRQGR